MPAGSIAAVSRPSVRMRFTPGLVGPGATLAIGTVATGAAGSSVIITNTGTPAAAVLNITIPRGDKGDKGDTGDKGWAPVLSLVADGARRVARVVDWAGGQGTKPASGSYVGATGLVADIANAIDLRGPAGSITVGTVTTGAPGSAAAVANVGTPEAAVLNITIPRGDVGADGFDGWTPAVAVITDGARRVLQVADWVGGEGVKPTTGLYVGATGLTPTLANAVDIRGPQGAAGVVADGDKGDITVSGGGATWTVDPNVIDFSKFQQVAQKSVLRGPASGTGNVIADTIANLLADLVTAGVLRSDQTKQITTGFTAAAFDLGTGSGTMTLNGASRQKQFIANNGAFTLVAPAADTDIDLLITNGASAGAITFSGFTVNANTGEALTTTSGNRFLVSVRRINGVSTYVIKALQ